MQSAVDGSHLPPAWELSPFLKQIFVAIPDLHPVDTNSFKNQNYMAKQVLTLATWAPSRIM